MSYTIKRFGVLSVAKFGAVLGVLWGFIAGLSMIFVLGATSMPAAMGRPFLSAGLGFAGFILMVVIAGILGFFGGAVIAFVYNIVLGGTGGIEMDLEPGAVEAKP